MNDLEGLHEDVGDCPEVEEHYEECECEDCLWQAAEDYEREQDYLLAQQELEDFEQADEYYEHWDNNDIDCPW